MAVASVSMSAKDIKGAIAQRRMVRSSFGGPMMTIIEATSETQSRCRWSEKMRNQTALFNNDQLQIVDVG